MSEKDSFNLDILTGAYSKPICAFSNYYFIQFVEVIGENHEEEL
jgi:hypothetical protein